jgi:hypothetical protein
VEGRFHKGFKEAVWGSGPVDPYATGTSIEIDEAKALTLLECAGPPVSMTQIRLENPAGGFGA